LESKVAEFEKLEGVYNETNEIARIGGWDVDLVNNKVTWTKVTHDIHEVSTGYIPELNSGISFYKEGWSRDLITKLFGEAIEKGLSFDDEFKLVTAKNNEIWIRSFGRPEFKDGKCVRVYGAFQDIDQQKKRQIELKAAKDRFQSIFDNSPVGTLLFDFSNNILAINPASLNIFGFENYSEEAIDALRFSDFIKPINIDILDDLKNHLSIQENKNFNVEIECTHTSGRTIICSMISSVMPGHENSDDLIITKIQDITQQKELQRLATENSNKFIKAFENSPNGMGVVDTNAEWVMINKNLSQMMGYTKNELLKLSFKDITHPDDQEIDTHFIESLLNRQIEHYSVEKRYVHKKGRIVHCHLNVSAIYDEHGHVTSLINQVVDMTQRLNAENDLKNTLNDLQGLLDATTQIIIVETDLNHVIRKFNRGAERMLGYKAEEVVGKKRPSLFHIEEEIEAKRIQLSKEHRDLLKADDIFSYNVPSGNTESQEWTYRRKNGSEFPVQLVVTAIRNQEGNIKGYLGVATDISELKSMEESLIISKEKAEMASKSKSEFLANMSHEIRTPLNGVIGFTDLLMKTELSESQGNYMQTVYNSANSLLDLINDILDFSKIEAGKLELNEEKIDIIELCEQTIDLFKHQAHKKGLEILLNIAPNIERFVWVDSLRLKQIMINLIGNAIKFTHKGEIELKIKVKTTNQNADKKIFTFSMRDTGIGIAPQNLDKIFFAFDQEDASTTRKFGGSGLGLTISNRLLELMGSNLEVESTTGVGSIFYFDVQLKTDTATDYGIEPLRNVNSVLIVDDNYNNRSILKEMLASINIQTKLTSNGVEAMDVLEKDNAFDLAIIDYHMPYINGLDLIKHIRQSLHIDKEKLPILLLHSSGEDDKISQKCKEYEVQFNKTKPIHMTDLFSLITQIENPRNNKSIHVPTTHNNVQIDLSELEFKILVAEDNPVNKHLTRTILKKLMPKVHLTEVDNGEEAVQAYKDQQIDLIFMDIQMPILSGFEASQQIRSLEKENQLKATPIIALTARTIKGERERCLSYGMDDYVTKPVIMQTLKKVLIKQLVVNKGQEITTD
ncbi:MAG TPA: PAS domain S-box protein, partial [Leeuwenhoekiella sp.]|nr:PAS domain S-box protein [Leeuwenhoekiella sp.]